MSVVSVIGAAALSMASWLPPDIEQAFKCMPDPLPRVPISYLSHRGERFPIQPGNLDQWRFTVQRMPCTDGSMHLLLFADNMDDRALEFAPAGDPSLWVLPELCADHLRIRQGGLSYQPALYAGAPRHATPFCARVTTFVTVLMHVPPGQGFDPSAPFEIDYVRGGAARTVVSVPAWQGGIPHSDWLTPHDSGHYYDPERPGQGIFMLVSPTREACLHVNPDHTQRSDCDLYSTFLVFFGYDDDGKQLWLTAGTSAERRDKVWHEADVAYTRGGRFGQMHDPAAVTRTRWGSVRWRIHGCYRLEAHYTRADGLTGTWNMVRAVGQTTGYAQCGDPDHAAVE